MGSLQGLIVQPCSTLSCGACIWALYVVEVILGIIGWTHFNTLRECTSMVLVVSYWAVIYNMAAVGGNSYPLSRVFHHAFAGTGIHFACFAMRFIQEARLKQQKISIHNNYGTASTP